MLSYLKVLSAIPIAILSVIGLVTTIGSVQEQKESALVDKVLSRSVVVQNTGGGKGSGIIVAKGFVLTNFHLFYEGFEMRVNGKPAVILKADVKNDLLLLSAETASIPPLKFAEKITRDEKIISAGNPLGHTGMVIRGRIAVIDNDGTIFTDAHVFFGCSGGGVYNAKAELVGIVRGIEGNTGDGFPYGIVIAPGVVQGFFLSENKLPPPLPVSFYRNSVLSKSH